MPVYQRDVSEIESSANASGAASRDGAATDAPEVRLGFSDDFRRFFVRGAATLLPTLITVLLLLKLWEILRDYLGQPIIFLLAQVSRHFQVSNGSSPGLSPWTAEALGVLLAIILVYIVGLFVGHFLGRAAWRLLEVGLMRIPLIRAIYPAVKQVTDFVLADRTSHLKSSQVVAVEPHASGIWSVGLVTGPGLGALSDAVGRDMVTVFIPSSPTAFSGYVVVVPRERVIELPLTVEQAMRLLVTGGVSRPGAIELSRAERGGPAVLAQPVGKIEGGACSSTVGPL